MELSEQTLEELERLFEDNDLKEDKMIEIPFLKGTMVSSKLALTLIEYSRHKLRRELKAEIERETCMKIINGLIKLCDA